MNYKILLINIIFFLTSCIDYNNVNISKKKIIINNFSNSGFALPYSDDLYKNKTINKKINDRDLILFQKKLKKGTTVKVYNPTNGKSIIAKVGKNSIYPNFNNSVISKRIFSELELTHEEPFVIIDEIIANSAFTAKKAKTFEVEKKVAGKAPVQNISINDLNDSKVKKVKLKKTKKFSYSVKIADFYFEKTAKLMINRTNTETTLKKVKIYKISEKSFRVYSGPYKNIKELKKAYIEVEKLGFENIEIIKND